LSGGTITAAQLAAAKKAVREGQRDDSVLGRALRELYAAEYAGHPYAAPIAGRPKEREAITLANFQAWTARYGPSNAALTLVGAFDTDSVVAQLRRTVGAAKARPVPSARIAPPKAVPGPVRVTLAGPTQLPLLLSGWRAPAGTDSSRVALNVLGRLLARGPYSRLGAALTRGDTALCAAVEGAYVPRREGSMLYVAATLRDAADSTAVLSVLEQQGQWLRSEPAASAELERLKNEIELQEMGERQTARGRAFALGSAWAVRGNWQAADLDLERLHRLTAAEVESVADRVMRIENWGAVWMWPGADAAARSGGAK
jgi:zinc protease